MRIFNILQHDSVETFKTLVFKRTHCAMQVLNGDGPESWPRSELVTQKAGPSGHRAMGMMVAILSIVSHFFHNILSYFAYSCLLGISNFIALYRNDKCWGSRCESICIVGIDLGIDSLFFADTILFHIKALVTHQFLVSANAKAETDAGDIQRQIKRCSEVRSCRLRRFKEVHL